MKSVTLAILFALQVLFATNLFGDPQQQKPNSTLCPCWGDIGDGGIQDAMLSLDQCLIYNVGHWDLHGSDVWFTNVALEDDGNDCVVAHMEAYRALGYPPRGYCRVWYGTAQASPPDCPDIDEPLDYDLSSEEIQSCIIAFQLLAERREELGYCPD